MLETREPIGTIVTVVETGGRDTRRAIFPGSPEEFARCLLGKDGPERLLLGDDGYILLPNPEQFLMKKGHLRLQYPVPNHQEWDVILPLAWALKQEMPHFLLQPVLMFPTQKQAI